MKLEALLFIFSCLICSHSSPMQFPPKLAKYIIENSHKPSIRYIFYSIEFNPTTDVNAIIQDVKNEVGQNYMGELEQMVAGKKYITLFALDYERKTKSKLNSKPWFKKDEFIEETLARNLNCDFDEK